MTAPLLDRLDAEALAWVEGAFASLTDDQKLAQVFTLLSYGSDEDMLAAQARFGPGGVTRMGGGDAAAERRVVAALNARAPVPLLVSADLEGSRQSLPGGAEWPNPLALAAVDDVAATAAVSRRMAEEARDHGINWTFTPLLDVNAAWRSPIVATRSYGSNPERVRAHALAHLRAVQEAGLAATLKHWPGEGHDDRDQHLLTTVNPLGIEDWEAVHGWLYREGVVAGAMTVMAAHVAWPAFARTMGAEGIEAFRPASVSRHLTTTLLRDRLGFQGLIVSDATGMAGLGAWAPRREALPALLDAGCDVILFQRDMEEDRRFLQDALDDGRLGWERVEDAVRRQLALKAALGLHRPAEDRPPADAAGARALAQVVARRAPTLVKDVAGTLPLDPARHRRVLVIAGGIVLPFRPEPLAFALPDMLRARGFAVTEYRPDTAIAPGAFDLVLILHGEETLLARGRVFLDWARLMGGAGRAMERWWHEVPTVLVSFGTPYLLYDAPRVPAYVNAYSTTATMQEAVADALTGRIAWNRRSPVDAFCGLEDARF